MSNDKNMHKSGWMVPPRPNVPREIEEAIQIAKDSYRKARASNSSENYYPGGCISDVPPKALYIPFIEIDGNQISIDWEFIDNTDCYLLRGSAVFTPIMPVKVISIVPSSIT